MVTPGRLASGMCASSLTERHHARRCCAPTVLCPNGAVARTVLCPAASPAPRLRREWRAQPVADDLHQALHGGVVVAGVALALADAGDESDHLLGRDVGT